MTIKSLTKTNFDTIYQAFSLTFADYEFQRNNRKIQLFQENSLK